MKKKASSKQKSASSRQSKSHQRKIDKRGKKEKQVVEVKREVKKVSFGAADDRPHLWEVRAREEKIVTSLSNVNAKEESEECAGAGGEDDDVVASDFRTERDEPVEKSARNLEQQRTTRDDGTTACAALGPNDPFRLGGTLTPRRGPQRLPAAHARARDRSSHLDRVTRSLAHPRAHASRSTPAPFARRRARLRAARSRIRRRRIRADASSNNRAHVSR